LIKFFKKYFLFKTFFKKFKKILTPFWFLLIDFPCFKLKYLITEPTENVFIVFLSDIEFLVLNFFWFILKKNKLKSLKLFFCKVTKLFLIKKYKCFCKYIFIKFFLFKNCFIFFLKIFFLKIFFINLFI
jgi:hypothetical protein